MKKTRVSKYSAESSDHIFKQFFENAPFYCYIVSSEGKIIDLNQRALEAMGYNRNELVGQPVSKIYAPESQEKMKELFDRWQTEGKIIDEEMTIITKDGRVRSVVLNVESVKDSDDKIQHSVSIQRDITDRKKAQLELQETKEKIKHIIEHSNEVFFVHDTDHKLTYISPQSEQVFGYTPKEMLIEWTDLITDNPMNEIGLELTVRAIETGEKQESYVLEVKHKNEKLIYVEIEESPVKDEAGNIINIVGAARDVTKSRTAEAALTNSEERFRDLVENINDVIYSTDANGVITYISPIIESFTGYKPSEIVGKKNIDFIHPEDLPMILQSLEDVMNGNLHPSEYRVKTKNGDHCWVRSSSKPIINEGEVKGIQGVILNITKEKKAEAKQKDIEFKLQNIIGNIPDTVVELDENGKFSYVSPQVADMFGYKCEEVEGTVSLAYLHPDDLPMILDAMEEALLEKKPMTLEYRAKHKNGGYVHVAAKGSMIEKDGEVKLAGVIRDVTAQKKAEEALRQSEEKFRMVFENANEGILYIDNMGNIMDANPKVLELTRSTKEDLVGKNFLELISLFKIDVDNISGMFEGILSDQPIEKSEWKVENLEGKESVLLANPSLLKKDGEVVGISVRLDDITDRKAAETKMIEEHSRAELYLDLLSHDINNLNQTIITANELLLLKPEITEKNQVYIQNTLDQAKAISELIMNVRKLSALQEGDFKQKSVDIKKVLSKSEKYINYAYPDRDIEITNSIPDTDVMVKGNELLQDVFDNILTNAVKYNRSEDVRVNITFDKDDDGFWKLMFKDNGPGVQDSMKDKIFQRFERGDEGVHGSGLGLTIAHEVVARCGGRVWVEDRVPGHTNRGSNFVVMLPKS